MAARRLHHNGDIEILQAGRRVDPDTARGPIRLRLVRTGCGLPVHTFRNADTPFDISGATSPTTTRCKIPEPCVNGYDAPSPTVGERLSAGRHAA